jgi:hypothetical protein
MRGGCTTVRRRYAYAPADITPRNPDTPIPHTLKI